MLESVRKVYSPRRYADAGAGRGIASLVSAAADLICPPRCPLCERILLPEEGLVCSGCRRKLEFIKEPFCLRCGKPLERPDREFCPDCERKPHLYDEGRSAFVYEKTMRLAVDRMKFLNRREYIPFFAAAILAAHKDALLRWRVQCIVPIPMHPRKKKERGFDQAELLARAVSSMSGIPVRTDLLIRTRYTKASRKLGADSRRKNLRGVFAVPDEVREGGPDALPRRVVLMDDIYTTGLTMDTAAGVLRRAGVREIYFLTICTGR